MKVLVYNNNVEGAWRKLNRKMAKEGIYQTLKIQQYYIPKSVKKRIKKKAAIGREWQRIRRRIEDKI